MAENRQKNEFWQKKMKHIYSLLDVDKNSILASTDFERLANRWVECGELNEEQGKKVRGCVLGYWTGISTAIGKDAVTEEEFAFSLSSLLDGKIWVLLCRYL